VPPGTYQLWVGYGKASVETRLEVKSGKLTQQTMTIPLGHINLDEAYQETDKKEDEKVQYYLYSVEKNANGKREEIANSNHKSTASFTVPPGTYQLWVGYGKASVETRLEVKSGKATEKTILLQKGDKE
jgi:Ca-activated chloride channel family protein